MNSVVGNILVVDDLQMMIQMTMNEIGEAYHVITSSTATEGLDILAHSHGRIDLVLLDIHLPDMDGYAFMSKMRADGHGNIPVIMMTADDDPVVEIEALKRGASDFIKKPLYAEILQNRVRNVLMRNRMEYDSLTGIYNRNKTFSEIAAMVKRYPDRKFAFMRFDIDGFSIYNSSMGDEEGDKLLCLGAYTLKNMKKDKDACIYGRIDADVFCVCELYDPALVKLRISHTLKCLEDYRNDYRIQASFGICVFDYHEESIERIYTNASLAAHTCKGIFDKHYAYYEEWMSGKYAQEQEVVNEMVEALEKREFVPFLQPKYELNSDEPTGAEALVRWIHPEKGMISPGKFIPVFEKNGFISRLDMYMWEEVCALLSKWKKEKRHPYPVSVNVSRISMYNPQLVEIFLGLIRKYDITPELLQLEITESAYMTNTELMKDTIKELQANGFTILMDDFGSGYSSLNTLKEIDVDILKVDMKFLPEGNTSARSEKILSSIIRMAGWLGIDTIAEGVETVEQRDFLKSIGCNFIQGYFYAKPMPVKEYEELISKSKLVVEKKRKTAFSSAVWSSDAKIEEIMAAIQLPVSIVELSATKIETIRVNRFYEDTFGQSSKTHMIEIDGQSLDYIVKEASVNGVAEGEFSCNDILGKTAIFRVKMKRLEQSKSASLLCATYIDITAEKLYGTQLKKLDKIVPLNRRTKMLVIDDSSMERDIVSDFFKEQFEINEAEDGRKGLEIFKKEKDQIAVIILDMMMPVMDGKAFLKEKNRMDPKGLIPVIVMSSDSNSDVQLDMLAMGVTDYITKPFEHRIFKQKVSNAIMHAERFVKIRQEYEEAIADYQTF